MKHPRYDEEMNCLDIEWFKLLMPLGVLPIPIPISQPDQTVEIWDGLNLDGLILTGGNSIQAISDLPNDNTSVERDDHENCLINCAISSKTPVLGVCRGMQFINYYFSGRLSKVTGHAGTRHFVSFIDQDDSLLPSAEVNSFHNYAIPVSNLGEGLIPLAKDESGNVEALRHTKHKVLGLMWHPEREGNPFHNDIQLIKGHFKL